MHQLHIANAEFHVPQMCCAEEAALLEKGLGRLNGVLASRPDYVDSVLRVEFQADQVDADAILDVIRRLGFEAERNEDAATDQPHDVKAAWNRTTQVGGLMLLVAVAARLTVGETTLPIAALTIASAVVSGVPVALAAFRALRLGLLDMNALMGFAAIGAVAIGEYFEAATAMFLFGVSLWLESHSMDRTRRAVRTLVELAPTVAHRIADGQTIDVDVKELRPGDRVLVKPGERIPIDGQVVSGASSVNQAPITGESMPIEKQSGDGLFAGSLNGEGSLEMEATRTADQTTLAHIRRLVAQAQGVQAPTERFINRFARRYTPIVISLAVLLAFGPPMAARLGAEWASTAEASEWFRRGLVLLVIACPCALVISTPVTIVSGLFFAARRGLLIKGGVHLENAGQIDCIALDKTGTVTTGCPRVVSIDPVAPYSEDDVLRVAAALERHSEHPLAEAIVAAADQRGLNGPEASQFAALRGFGIRGCIDGETFYVGSPRLFREERLGGDAGFEDVSEENTQTLAHVGSATQAWGTIRLADPPREGASQAIAELKRLGVRPIVMLSGDGRRVVERLAEEVGVDEVHGELLPEDKVVRVEALLKQYPNLAMVGDGINDAPALAAARIGIALGSGASDTALETADIVVMAPRLERLVELVRLGRRCRRLLGENIVLALAIKAVVLALAAMGLATLWMAVVADVGASLIVTANGLRLGGKARGEGRD